MQTHMPIGYKMVDGKIQIDKEKSKTVKKIFTEYLKGKSLLSIAKNLKESRVANANNKTNWTHGAVGKILENTKYMGDEFYPPLITKEKYQRVQAKRKHKEKQVGKTHQLNSTRNKNIFASKVFCGECGEPYRKYIEHSGKAWEKVRWKCKKYIYQNRVKCTNVFYFEAELKTVALNAINILIARPKLLNHWPPKEIIKPNKELTEVEKRIREIKENGEFSSQELARLIFKRAELVYNSSKINDYEVRTQTIKEMLTEKLTGFDEKIFSVIVSKIVIYKDGRVETQFINGLKVSDTLEYKRKEDHNGCSKKESGSHTATDEV